MEREKEELEKPENSAIQLIEKQDVKEETIIKEETIAIKKKKNKIVIISICVALILAIVGIFSTIFAIINNKSTYIVNGVQVGQINLSKMTKENAKEVLNEIYSKNEDNEICFKYNEFEEITTYKALDVEYKIDEAINKSYEIGRSGNLIKDNFDILKYWFKGIQIDIAFVFDEEVAFQIIPNINNSIEGAVVQPEYYQDGAKLIVTQGTAGLKVNEDKFLQEIYNSIKNNTKSCEIEIPFNNVEPNEIDLEEIHNEIYKEVKDAYYTKEPFTIYPEVEGIDFNIEEAKLLLEEEKEQYEIPLIITKPSKTTKDIGTEASPDLLATFSTKYLASNVNRTTNLKLAANKINGTVLLPGQEFSYNKTVGERTAQAGFKTAAIYSNGKVVDGIGGGICQISSTLYDAVVMADLEVTERRNHQFVTSYLEGGKDATVVWGSQDFKFKNTRDYPVRIVATVQGGVATVQIWGVKQEVEYEITIETKKTATIAYTTQYVQDSSLPSGQQKVVQQGSNGSKYEAYKVKRLNGQIISTTLLSKDTYNAKKKIVNVGTAQ